MNRIHAGILALSLCVPSFSSIRIPFSGPMGATAGAGSVLGWEVSGQGLNPAVGGIQILGFSFSTYAPFGIENLRISEAGMIWSGAKWGMGVDYRGWEGPVGYSSSMEIREGLNLGKGATVGLSIQGMDENGISRVNEWGAGFIWNGIPFIKLGVMASAAIESENDPFHAGLGADAGWALKNGYGFRLCVESHYLPNQSLDWRFGARLRLHSLLSLHAGYNPSAETFGLGLRFGMGSWEGFHAMRIHSELGSSSLQGLQWHRHLGNLSY